MSDRELFPGLYETLITRGLADALASTPPELVSTEPPDPAELPEILARHAAHLVRRTVEGMRGEQRLAAGVALVNAIGDACVSAQPADQVLDDGRMLREVRALDTSRLPVRGRTSPCPRMPSSSTVRESRGSATRSRRR